ncbi:MAG: ABC transporter substrate-binding protein [Alphaproteobacteria bacterium]|nr:ABC transporter substrate-binding protein [Alphaproteobacteria bacterium]
MPKHKFIWRALLAAALALLPLASAAAAEPAPANAIKVGLLAPFSGPFADFGDQFMKGVEIYMQEHGDTVAGHKIVVLKRDANGVDPAQTKRQAQALLTRDHVQFLAGFGLTPDALATGPLGTEAKVPMVIMNAATGFITAKSPYFVRFSFTLAQLVTPLGQWAVQNGLKNVYIAVSDYAPGYEAEKAFDKAFTAAGGHIVGSVHIPLLNPEFAPYVQRIKDAKPQAVFLFLPTGQQPTAFVRQYIQFGLRKAGIKLLGATEIIDDQALGMLGDDALGVISTQVYSYAHPSALNRKYVSDWKKRFGAHPQPDFMSVAAYDGMAAIYAVVKRLHGIIDGDKAMAAFKGLKFESPRGPIEVDPATREMIENIYIRRVERVNGELVNKEIVTFPAVKAP